MTAYTYSFTEKTFKEGLKMLLETYGENSKMYSINGLDITIKKSKGNKNAMYFANRLAVNSINFKASAE